HSDAETLHCPSQNLFVVSLLLFFLMLRRPPRSTLFPTRRSSDLVSVPRWKEAFLHPKEALGIVVQVVESPDDPPRAHWRKPPPMPAAAPPPVQLLGLRLSAHSAERARRQWATLLGGDASLEGGLHVFRWAQSPLRIAVQIQPTGEEGPTAIEIVPSSRPVSGLGAPAPDLGTVFVDAR